MIVRFGLHLRRPDISDANFRSRWRDQHGPLKRKLPGLRRYHQNHVVDRRQLGVTNARVHDFDGFSQLWFDDLHSMSSAFATEQAREVGEDASYFIAETKVVTAIQHVVIPVQEGAPLIKRMVILRRRQDVSPEKFMSEWFNLHAVLVKRLCGVKGYVQNLVIDRSVESRPATYDELPIDGIVELWFTDTDSMNAAYAADAPKTLMTHGTEFIADISTFLVETEEIV